MVMDTEGGASRPENELLVGWYIDGRPFNIICEMFGGTLIGIQLSDKFPDSRHQ